MRRKKAWDKEDNSMAHQKALLRLTNLPKRARVLDLFCGNGEMYNRAYKGRVEYYHGVDKEKIHNPKICTLTNNLVYITQNTLDDFNVFDLDDYGTPWKQLYLILKKLKRDEVTIFVTDGLVLRQKMDGTVSKFVSATEQVPRKMNIPGLNRWYVDIFATMLLDLEKRYNWKTVKAQYFHNERQTVYYWVIKLKKVKPGSTDVYCDLAVKRWENFTGQKAVKLDGN